MHIKLRLTDGHSVAVEFYAIDCKSLEEGCRRAWVKYIKIFGEQRHWEASKQLQSRLKFIDAWLAKKQKQHAQNDNALNALLGQACTWRYRARDEYGKNMLPENLQLHIASIDGYTWVSSKQYTLAGKPLGLTGGHPVHRDMSKNDFAGLWTAATLTHNHDKNICIFCENFASWAFDDANQKPTRKLEIVRYDNDDEPRA